MRNNYIEELSIERKMITEAAKKHFHNLYTEEFVLRPKLDNLQFDTLDYINKEMLETDFTEDEIVAALKSCDGDKAPGPDGFNLKFMQTFWYLLKEDVFNVFKEFHSDGEFVKFLNSTFIVLIPKKEWANCLLV